MRKGGLRLIENKVLVEVDNEEHNYLLIHTLQGRIDVLSYVEAECIKKWDGGLLVYPKNEVEQVFYDELVENGYMVRCREEENNLVEHMMMNCRQKHYKMMTEKHRVVFVITYMCNFSCPYCYEQASCYKENKILTKDMVDKIYELQGESIEKITFYGGEPFLPETKPIVEYIVNKSPKALYSAVTNGYYLDEFIDILCNIKIDYIMITLDGTEEIHNKTRIQTNGEGTYQKIVGNIRKCLKKQIRTKIRMNISDLNIENCLKLREKFIEEYEDEYKKGWLSFELQPIFQTSTGVKSSLNERLLFDKSASDGKTYNYNVTAITVSPILKEFVNSLQKIFIPKYCYCDAEGSVLYYDAEGRIYSCILSVNRKEASIGTYYPNYELKEQSIFTRNIETIEKCKSCKLKFLCGGGCANEIIDESGNALKANCTAILDEIYYELPKLYKKYTKSRKA